MVDRVVEGVQAILKELNEAVETEIEEKRAKIVAGTSRASISEQEKYSKELLEVEYRRNKVQFSAQVCYFWSIVSVSQTGFFIGFNRSGLGVTCCFKKT